MSIFGRLDGSNFTSVLTNSDLINEEMKTDYYNKLETTNLLSNKSDITHNHNSTYVARTNGILDTSLNCNNQELNNTTKVTSSDVNDLYIQCTVPRALYLGETYNNYMKMDLDLITSYKNVDMTTHSIINVVDPVLAQDASTKNYVDTQISGINLTPYFKHNGTVNASGNFNLNNFNFNNVVNMNSGGVNDLIISTPAAQILRLRNNVTDILTLSSSDVEINTSLNMTTHSIINVVDPVLAQDASTKNYVDTQISGINLTPYFKKDGSVAMTGNINLDNYYLNNASNIVSYATSNLTYKVPSTYSHDFQINSISKFRVDGSTSTIKSYMPLDMTNNGKIINLLDGVSSSDAVTKYQLDNAYDLTPYFKKDGSVAMTGNINLNSFNINNITTLNGTTSLNYNAVTAYVHSFKVNNIETAYIDNNSIFLDATKYLNCNAKTRIKDNLILVNEGINSTFPLTTLHANTTMVCATNTVDNNATNIKIQNLHAVSVGSVQARIDFVGKNDTEEYWSGYLACMKRGLTTDRMSSFLIAPCYSSNPNAYFEFFQNGTTAAANTFFVEVSMSVLAHLIQFMLPIKIFLQQDMLYKNLQVMIHISLIKKVMEQMLLELDVKVQTVNI